MVAGKGFVAAIAVERHGNVLASQFGEVVQRQSGRICERLAEMLEQELHRGRDIAEGERKLVVIGRVALGNGAGVRQLGETRFLEPHRKCFHRTGAGLRHQGKHNAGIEAAAQMRAQRDFADQAHAHRVAGDGAQFFD